VDKDYRKITIITPSFNQREFIEDNIQAVLDQKYPCFEHIIIDGGSDDGTVDILKKYDHLIWVSENDRGQSDAINKGLGLATGEIIGWCNSDDYYLPKTFDLVIETFEKYNPEWVIGGMAYRYELSKDITERVSHPIDYSALLKNPFIVRQASAFYSSKIFREVNGVNDSLYMVMDYDLWIRIAKLSEPVLIDNIFAVFRLHDKQKTSLNNMRKQLEELKNICFREGDLTAYSLAKRRYYKKKAKQFVKILLVNLGLLDKKYLSFSIRTPIN